MRQILHFMRPALVGFLILTTICGVVYPAVMTGIAQLAFPKQAHGDEMLIGKAYEGAESLIGRPIGVTNLSPTSEEQRALVEKRIAWWHEFDPGNTDDIPAELVMGSGSGVDPNVSPAGAAYQVKRIADARGMSEDAVRAVILDCTTSRFLGFWGEPAVNVNEVNLALDEVR